MKGIALAIIGAIAIFSASLADARTQRGYIKRDGTYVAPHQKTNPDQQRFNNRGSKTNGGKQRDEFSNPPAFNKPKRIKKQ
ncbi:MAG: hypothetical protein Q7T25_06025, partial [Sideroxyarcus sp.]|nr:hypothetical protein [Sideroxyarcus sp.]